MRLPGQVARLTLKLTDSPLDSPIEPMPPEKSPIASGSAETALFEAAPKPGATDPAANLAQPLLAVAPVAPALNA